MPTFKFFEDCSFCQSRIGSKHCLLPFQLTKEYVPPNDEVSAIIDVTELHMHYGIHLLKNNFEISHWVTVRPTSEQITEYSQSVQSRTSDWYQPIAPLYEQTPSSIASYADNSCQTDSSKDEDNTSRRLKVKSTDEITETSNVSGQLKKTWAQATEESDGTTKSPKEDEHDINVTDIKTTISPIPDTKEKKGESKLINHETESHIAQDLLMAIKTAFNLHAKQKSGLRTFELPNSIMFESNIRSLAGGKYKPSIKTDLESPKSLSREIMAKHSHENIQLWESGERNTTTKNCILNFPDFQLPVDDRSQTKLEDSLCRYFHGFGRLERVDSLQLDRMINFIKFTLERDGYPNAFTWMTNRIHLLRLFSEQGKGKETLKPEVSSTKKIRQPFPAVDQRMIDHVNSHLQIFVNKRINEAGSHIPTMTDETKITKFLFLLATEFLYRNKGWHNENSFTSPAHLMKIEESSGLKSQENEAFYTFSLLKDILDDFRRSFKDRYPKAGPPDSTTTALLR